MTKNNIKWIEKKREEFIKILNKGRSGDLDAFGCAEYNPEEAEEAWQLTLSTLEEYAKARDKILKGYMPLEEDVWQNLDKLNTTYGLKQEGK